MTNEEIKKAIAEKQAEIEKLAETIKPKIESWPHYYKTQYNHIKALSETEVIVVWPTQILHTMYYELTFNRQIVSEDYEPITAEQFNERFNEVMTMLIDKAI